MRKMMLVTLDPKRLQQELERPDFAALVGEGWQVATAVILEDQQKPDDPHRIGLVLYPPVTERWPAPPWRWVAAAVLVVAAGVALGTAPLGLLALAW